MTDYVEKATEMVKVVSTCVAGGVKGSGDIVENAADVTESLLKSPNPLTPPLLMAAGLMNPSGTLAGQATIIAAGTIAATSGNVKDGCVTNVEQHYQEKITAQVAKTVAAQPDMTPADRLSAIQNAVKQLATPVPSLDNGR